MQQQENNIFDNWKRNFNITFALCAMHQRAIVVPFRNRWGVRALGVPCAWAFVLMAAWAIFSQDPFMWWWVGIW